MNQYFGSARRKFLVKGIFFSTSLRQEILRDYFLLVKETRIRSFFGGAVVYLGPPPPPLSIEV